MRPTKPIVFELQRATSYSISNQAAAAEAPDDDEAGARMYNEWRGDDRSCARVAYLILPPQLLQLQLLLMALAAVSCPL